MAYMSQEKKKKIAEELKKVLAGTGIKYTLSVHNHSTLCMNIKSGPIDFIGSYEAAMKAKQDSGFVVEERTFQNIENMKKSQYMDVNVYWYKEHFTGLALEILEKIIDTMNVGNHNNSDIMTDYHDVGWYVDVNIGKWDKPYVCTAQAAVDQAKVNAKKVELQEKMEALKMELVQTEVQYNLLCGAAA